MPAPGRHGAYMMGSDQPIEFTDDNVRQYVANPQTVADLAQMPDVPKGVTTGDDWVAAIRKAQWISDAQVDAFVGTGSIITDDRPLSEYFLWRRYGLDDKTYIDEMTLRAHTPK
jgi:hypothetical protein